ncbi:MAG: PEP-CTERM sorting domain-containing protein [Verrucomicrobiae bacterium]|nr:PEP-CTERM sorting domain-containing protein [Verrucomicrobiae bacterium]
MTLMRYTRPFPSVIAFALAVSSAHASQEGFVTPSWRGTPGTLYHGWESFTSSSGDPGSRPDLPGSGTAATLFQHDPGAFITGSGNIYNPGGISSFTLRQSSLDPVGLVVFQARTLGAELDYASVQLAYDVGAGTQLLMTSRTETDRGTLLGASVSSLWEWNLTDSGVTSFEIRFVADGSSLSLDSITLDTRSGGVVPEPSTWALMLLGVAGLAVRLRKARHE